jgi:uncharacterized protein
MGASSLCSSCFGRRDDWPCQLVTARFFRARRWAFVVGLIGMGAIAAFMLNTPTLATPRPFPLLILAGLLVGFGTVMGSGCTSGHGVCGIGRRSVRSIVATVVFMGAGIVTVTLVKLLNS